MAIPSFFTKHMQRQGQVPPVAPNAGILKMLQDMEAESPEGLREGNLLNRYPVEAPLIETNPEYLAKLREKSLWGPEQFTDAQSLPDAGMSEQSSPFPWNEPTDEREAIAQSKVVGPLEVTGIAPWEYQEGDDASALINSKKIPMFGEGPSDLPIEDWRTLINKAVDQKAIVIPEEDPEQMKQQEHKKALEKALRDVLRRSQEPEEFEL